MQFSDGSEAPTTAAKEGILVEGDGGADDLAAVTTNEVAYETILAKIGFGRAQWLLLLISGLMTITSMGAQISIGILAIAAHCEFAMSQSEKGVMMSACVAGIFLSTYFWGYVSDAIGRRSVLLYSMFGASALQFALMFVTNIWLFNVINLFVGICLGGISASIYAYLGEYNTEQYRAVVINYSTMFVSICTIYVSATSWWILSASWSVSVYDGFAFRPWRLIILACLLPGLIGALLMLQFPESPKLLLAHGKELEARVAIEWIAQFNRRRSVASLLKCDDYHLKPEVMVSREEERDRGAAGVLVTLRAIWRATVPLVHKPHGKHFTISAAVIFGMFFSNAALAVWFPEIINRSAGAESAGKASTICAMLDASFERQPSPAMEQASAQCDAAIATKAFVSNMAVGLVNTIGFALQGVLLNPLGRKRVLLGSLAIAIVSGVLLRFVADATVVLVLFCFFIVMPSLSISVMCGAVVDLMPTPLRSKAVSICFTLGRLAIVISTYLMGVMLEPLCNTTFGMFIVVLIVCAGLVRFLPI